MQPAHYETSVMKTLFDLGEIDEAIRLQDALSRANRVLAGVLAEGEESVFQRREAMRAAMDAAVGQN